MKVLLSLIVAAVVMGPGLARAEGGAVSMTSGDMYATCAAYGIYENCYQVLSGFVASLGLPFVVTASPVKNPEPGRVVVSGSNSDDERSPF